MDACRLTIDGPAAVQDPMRRTGSFRDTLAAFRAARAAGIRVEPLVILVRFNAPHVAATLRLLLAEGFDDLALQAGIRGDAGAGDRRASVHPDPGSPWNDLLTAAEYRTVLRRALACLDAAGAPHRQARDRFIRNEPMFARLFFELHRGDEYERIVRRQPRKDVLPFVLRADGAVLCQDGLPEIGRFPGGSFREIYDAAHPLRWFATGGHPRYVAEKQRAFAKCRACPARRHCPPVLAGWQGRRLFYQPDVHCWVRD
jgi:MoaA/NifB/PqqE/SkfB family radical SAM enzyme